MVKKLTSYQKLKNENIWLKDKLDELHNAIRILKKSVGFNNSVTGETILTGNEQEIIKLALTIEEIKRGIKGLPDL